MVVSSDAINLFAREQGFHVPFWGRIDFSAQEILQYMSLLNEGMLSLGSREIILTSLSLPGLSALVFDEELIIHQAAVNEQPEQLLVVPITMLEETIERFKNMVRSDAMALSSERLITVVRSHMQQEL